MRPRKTRPGPIVAGLFAAAMALAGTARAQSVEEFYRKTPLSIYVGSGAGGGFDEIARVFAPHFARHLPGSPAVVVKNMPGAGGLINVNYMYNTAPRDGSAIAAPFNTVFMLPLFGDPSAKFDPRRFTWLGSLDKQTATCAAWHTSPLRSIADARQREVLVSATGTNSTPAVFPNVLNALLGTRFKVISGYATTEMRLALERGEVEGICGLALQTYKAVAPQWIADRQIRFLLQLGLTRSAELPDVPMALDAMTSADDRAVFELVVLPQEFGRPFIAPPDLPPDRTRALRSAFDATLKDPAFRADAARIKLDLEAMTGEAIVSLLARAYDAPKAQVARAATFSAAP